MLTTPKSRSQSTPSGAEIYVTHSDVSGAKAAYERALRIFERSLPPRHPNIRFVQHNLGRLR